MEPKDLLPDSGFNYFEPFNVRFRKKHYSCYVRRKYLNNSLHRALKIKIKTKKLYPKIVKDFRACTN